nr:hypothetical protein HmN_000619900 [Hymenolepis microstoma]
MADEVKRAEAFDWPLAVCPSTQSVSEVERLHPQVTLCAHAMTCPTAVNDGILSPFYISADSLLDVQTDQRLLCQLTTSFPLRLDAAIEQHAVAKGMEVEKRANHGKTIDSMGGLFSSRGLRCNNSPRPILSQPPPLCLCPSDMF